MNYYTARLTLSDRVSIEAGIYARKTFKEIAREIQKHPSTVSREIRNNRTLVTGTHSFGKDCRYATECKVKKLCGKPKCCHRCVTCSRNDCRAICPKYDTRRCNIKHKPPYVCNTCDRRRTCKADRAYYSAKQADAMAARRYSESHMGIRTRGDQLEKMDTLVSNLIRKGQPLTHIHAEHGKKLGVTERTLYNYIDAGVFSIGNIDLRRKVGYRPRKKKYVLPLGFANQEYRKGRTYNDFLKYLEVHPDTPVVELDTLSGVREQGKRLLTMNFNENNLMLLFILRDGKADTVIETFDYLTSLLGVETFRKVFPILLTDNGPEFRRVHEIERTVEGKRRTKMFFCDPYTSWQKPHIEKNHGFVRYVLKKGKSLNPFTQQDITLLANHINSIKRAGLDGCCPYELVVDPSLKLLLSLLDLKQIPSDEVFLKPALLQPR